MERTEFFRLVRHDSRNWWYYQQLREQGNHTEARAREIESVRSRIKDIRGMRADGGYCSVGRGGWSFHRRNSSTHGYGGKDDHAVQLAIACGIPTVDTLAISDHDIYNTVAFPMCSPGNTLCKPPYNGFSYVSLGLFLTLRARIGAKLYNYTPTEEDNRLADEFLVQLAERRLEREKEELAL